MRVGLGTLLLWQVVCWQASAQANSPGQFRLRGYVFDSLTRKALSQATITLLSGADSSTRLIQLADEKGQFLLSGILRGRYQLRITYVGYRPLRRQIVINDQIPVVDMGVLLMQPLVVRLREVNVQRQLPIAFKRDTVVFDAGAYTTLADAVAEDLLRRLPGITVAADGSIQALGQRVQQIYVNGQPFFSHDPAVAIRQLPAGLIYRIQLYDRQSDQAAFSGVDDGTRNKTLNIITTPAGRRGEFGQETAGVGPAKQYQFGGGINYFRDSRQLSVLGQTNNISQRGYSLPVSSWRTSANTQTQPGGITRSKGVAVNYNDHWGKRVIVTVSCLFSRDMTQTQQVTRRQTIVPDSTYRSGLDSSRSLLISDRQDSNVLHQGSHSANGQLAYQIDAANSMRWTLGLTGYQSRAEASWLTSTLTGGQQALLNRSILCDTTVSANRTLMSTLLWAHRFRQPGRTLSMTLNLNRNRQRSDGINLSESRFYRQSGNVDSVRTVQLRQRTSQQINAGDNEWVLTYAQPLRAGQLLAIRYTGFANRSAMTRLVADLRTASNPAESYDAALSGDYQSTFMTHRLGGDWQLHTTCYRFTLGADIQQSNLQLADQVGHNLVDKQYINLLPHIEFEPHLPTNRYLQIRYRTRVNAPLVSQLQPVVNVTNPLVVQRGNPNLRPEYSHEVSINYNRFQTTNNRSLFALITARLINYQIVSATSVDAAGVQSLQPVNVNGYLSTNGIIALGRPLRIGPLSGTLNLTTRIGLIRGINLIDSRLNRSTTLSASEEGNLNLALSNRFEFTALMGVTYQGASYSLQKRTTNRSVTTVLSAGLSGSLPLGFRVTTDITYSALAGRSTGYNQPYTLWNGSIGHSLLKGQRGEVRLQVIDLLDQNRSLLRIITDTYIEDNQSQVLKRYFLLSLVYNINRFGSTSSR